VAVPVSCACRRDPGKHPNHKVASVKKEAILQTLRTGFFEVAANISFSCSRTTKAWVKR
jgi:hypothetical protein